MDPWKGSSSEKSTTLTTCEVGFRSRDKSMRTRFSKKSIVEIKASTWIWNRRKSNKCVIRLVLLHIAINRIFFTLCAILINKSSYLGKRERTCKCLEAFIEVKWRYTFKKYNWRSTEREQIYANLFIITLFKYVKDWN